MGIHKGEPGWRDAPTLQQQGRRGPRPGVAGRQWRGLVDHAKAHGQEHIGPAEVSTGVASCGIDERGLSEVQCRLLTVLRARGRPPGLETLAALVDKSAQAVATPSYADLLQLGLLSRTPLGNVALPAHGNACHCVPAPRPRAPAKALLVTHQDHVSRENPPSSPMVPTADRVFLRDFSAFCREDSVMVLSRTRPTGAPG
ncbi:MAG: hypothetical protein AB1486_12750 [Planctomycetota bacterium]